MRLVHASSVIFLLMMNVACSHWSEQRCGDSYIQPLIEPMVIDGRVFPRKVLNSSPNMIQYIHGQRSFNGQDASVYFNQLSILLDDLSFVSASEFSDAWNCLSIAVESTDNIVWLYNTADKIKTIQPDVMLRAKQLKAVSDRDRLWDEYTRTPDVSVSGQDLQLDDILFLEDGSRERLILVARPLVPNELRLPLDAAMSHIISSEGSSQTQPRSVSAQYVAYPRDEGEKRIVIVFDGFPDPKSEGLTIVVGQLGVNPQSGFKVTLSGELIKDKRMYLMLPEGSLEAL